MARSAKTRPDKGTDQATTDAESGIADAEVIAETPPEDGMAVVPDHAKAAADDGHPVPPVDGDAPDDTPADTPTEEIALPDPEPASGLAVEPEPDPVEEEAAPPPRPEPEPVRAAAVPPPAPVTVKRVGFLPVFLGGVVAAGLGLVVGWQGLLPNPSGAATDAALADQSARIGDLADAVAAIPAPAPMPDLAPLSADIAALRADLAPLADRIAALETRLDTMERAPANDGTLSAAAIAAWQQDIEDLKSAVATQVTQTDALASAAAARDAALSGLQDAMTAQQADMARMVEEASQRLDAAQSTVAGIEQAATANATATLRRAALASLQTAVDSGQPFDGLVAELTATGVAAPDALALPAADGIPTLAALTESFPEAARAALSAARSEGLADDGSNRVMSFLRSQLDVRSVEPREGDDPDAILSRAEAALREGRVADTLAEIGTLPEVVRAPMSDWVAAAESRAAAVAALQSLAETLPAPETSN